MATEIQGEPKAWAGSRDEEGHRTYELTWLIKGLVTDGPANVMQTPGLPVPGSLWAFYADIDSYAWCRATLKLQPHQAKEGERHRFWNLTQTFSNKPLPPNLQRCNDTPVEDPLLEPQKVGGSWQKFTQEATHDRFGRPITNSAWEMIRGPSVEFDESRDTVKVEQNVADLDYPTVAAMRDSLNDDTLWGFPARTVKLSGFNWDRKFYGQCYKYYTRVFEFDINPRGWDRDVLDEGTKVLHGHWGTGSLTGTGEGSGWILDNIADAPPDPYNPQHFDRYKDRNGENNRVILNGAGQPAGVVLGRNQFYMAVQTNTGVALTTASRWVLVVGSLTPTTWSSIRIYQRGELVEKDGPKYICTKNNALGTAPASDSTHWSVVVSPSNQGVYNPATTYTAGQYVTNPDAATTQAGSVHIEKYGMANFLLLGIPAFL